MIEFTRQKPIVHFAVYEHRVMTQQKILTPYRAIVLRDNQGYVHAFTGLELFTCPYTGRKPSLDYRAKNQLIYICQALNYMLDNGMRKITEITVDLIGSYFRDYIQTPKAEGTQLYRSKQSVDKCQVYVSHFFANLTTVLPMQYDAEDLLDKQYSRRNSHARREDMRYVPKFRGKPLAAHRPTILRDMPEQAAWRLVELAKIYDPMIAFGITCQLLAGLRAGEVVNLRQPLSPASNTPSINVEKRGTTINKIKIDLTKELLLRKDGCSVGRIKKERTQDVFYDFVADFYRHYQDHLEYIKDKPCDTEYMPLFTVSTGQAMTVKTYTNRVKKLIRNYLLGDLLRSGDESCVIFANRFREHDFGPHVFRHIFTCKLLLAGLERDEIMYYRGDKSPESATVYLQNKEALLNPAHSMHDCALAALARIGKEYYGQR